jgi:hypothetical protein
MSALESAAAITSEPSATAAGGSMAATSAAARKNVPAAMFAYQIGCSALRVPRQSFELAQRACGIAVSHRGWR